MPLPQPDFENCSNAPLLSVCIVTYNHVHYIRQCIESVLSQQTQFPFEVIIGDDCSTDGTTQIVDEFAAAYPHLIVKVPYEKNVGATVNYNYVHSLARGKYVAHCDGDDMMLPGKLQKQVDFLESHPDYSVVWHRSIYFNDKGMEVNEGIRPGRSGPIGEEVSFGYALRVGTFATHSSMMYRKSARKTYNPEFYTLDLFYTLEYLSAGKGMILNDFLGKYRVDSSSSVRKDQTFMRITCLNHWRYYLNQFPEQRPNIFIFALMQTLIDAKNGRKTWKDWLKLTIDTAGWFNLPDMIDSFRSTKYLRIPDAIRYA